MAASALALAAGPASADTIPVGAERVEGGVFHASDCQAEMSIWHKAVGQYWAYANTISQAWGVQCKATAYSTDSSQNSSSTYWAQYGQGWAKSGGVWDAGNREAYVCVVAYDLQGNFLGKACGGKW
ncbi:hypothetical protein ABT187_36585 [Streptomyces sp. NPDC001817]|uniref:hypothetical protein n=1 Tax=Streptomyces sp. NPDC001817 TaxID=3154398 RepID=UPI00332EA921